MERNHRENVMLQVKDLWVSYEGIDAISGVTINVKEKETVAVIGANGAGKTTLLTAISGINRARRGTICFLGKRIEHLSGHGIVNMGLIHIPERDKIFREMRTRENLLLGSIGRTSSNEFRNDLERVFKLFPILKRREVQIAGTLSGGEQQMLALGRALISRPRLLMMDEPSLGLAPLMVENIFDTVRELAKGGLPILLVEQNAVQALNVAHRGYVLRGGKLILTGDVEKLQSNPDVVHAYIGKKGYRKFERR